MQVARDVSVLLRSAGGSPLAVEQAFGRGRVVVQAVPLGVGWSNLPARQAFVVLAHEWLWYLAGPSMTQWNLAPGERLLLALPGQEFDPRAVVTTPRGSTIELRSRPADGRREFRYGGTLWPGAYELTAQSTDGPRTFRFVVSRDAGESDLTPMSDAEQETLTLAAGLRFAGDALACAPGRQAPQGREPLWSALLCLLLLLMLAELLVGGSINRLRATEAPAVEMNTD